jgi:hypothetical protein
VLFMVGVQQLNKPIARSFNKRDAANVLAGMIEHTIQKQWSPTLADVSAQSIELCSTVLFVRSCLV